MQRVYWSLRGLLAVCVFVGCTTDGDQELLSGTTQPQHLCDHFYRFGERPQQLKLQTDSIIDVGDLPDGIIDVGDLPDGIIDVGDLPDGIIDVGDLPDGIIDVGDLPDGIIDVGDLPDGFGHCERLVHIRSNDVCQPLLGLAPPELPKGKPLGLCLTESVRHAPATCILLSC